MKHSTININVECFSSLELLNFLHASRWQSVEVNGLEYKKLFNNRVEEKKL